MKFSEFKYQRPDIESLQKKINDLTALIGESNSFETELKAVKSMFALEDDYDSMQTLVTIRNSVDTTDKFYEDEQDFFDENNPKLQEFFQNFNKKIIISKHRSLLEKEFGNLMFVMIEQELKTFNPEIIPDLQVENKLQTEYQKLTASAKISFDGGVYNLSQMGPFIQNLNRDVRHRAQLAVSNFFSIKETEIDRIYDEMVQVRTKIAKSLGYSNFVQLGYDRLRRVDYTAKEVKTYRDQVYRDVVPMVSELVVRKGKRIGIENPKSYDLPLSFKSGNPKPKGNRAWQVERAIKMYDNLSPITGKFFRRMVDMDVLELDAKPGKSGGGYCTFITNHDTPYIFANFNGTQGDVEVLTHEAGHAFQVYQSRNLIPPYRWPTYEACEIHSMSMEFITWPWMKDFFLEDTEKFKFNHLSGAISFLPYGVAVDEFQHTIYKNPDMTPDERKLAWKNIENKYLPFKDYDDDEFMKKGTYWFRQSHIFASPFYYIDYTLAQVCAFEYWIMSNNDPDKAFESYLSLCNLGGSKSFVNLLIDNKLKNPFVDGTIKELMKPIKAYLDNIDDMKL
ncbi:MAG: M3 family oligoendopeptidase [Tenericutes bacterium]|nr:M3 family oligoendopeptidase [Mycoplasmatota bacterium]